MERITLKTAFQLADEAGRIGLEHQAIIVPIEIKIFNQHVPLALQEALDDFAQKISLKSQSSSKNPDDYTKPSREITFLWKSNHGEISISYSFSPHEPFSVVAHSQMKEIIKLQSQNPSIEKSIKFVYTYDSSAQGGPSFGLVYKPLAGLKFFLLDRKTSTYMEVVSVDAVKKVLDDYIERDRLHHKQPRQKLEIPDEKISPVVFASIRGIDPQCMYPAPVTTRTPMDRSDGGLT